MTQNDKGMTESAQRVLICDDEQHIARFIRVNLERQGHVVECASDGPSAIEFLSNHSFDLVVLDSEMPGSEVIRDWVADREAANIVKLITRESTRFHR